VFVEDAVRDDEIEGVNVALDETTGKHKLFA
jgi:hypothetical protein